MNLIKYFGYVELQALKKTVFELCYIWGKHQMSWLTDQTSYDIS